VQEVSSNTFTPPHSLKTAVFFKTEKYRVFKVSTLGNFMQTKTKYEEIAFKELRAILQAIKILRTLREGIFAAKTTEREKGRASGLCGI
jgi:hypothetical protein